jgi:SPP1 family predicted phage head-tail adaptor
MTIYSAQPGRYRHRVTIQQQIEIRDGEDGGVNVAWVAFVVGVPAEVLTGPGREPVAANAEQAEITARINLRWFPGLTAKMRILWDDHVFNISQPPTADSTGRREWRCVCSDGLNDGR